MINVPQITADLARMPDRSLQQYAQMHRNDPYIVALALAESNRRKQLRIGAQAGQAQQMPTVVEQDLAQMAPEQVGIGSLPEQSLAKMAGGGIVAFEAGGEVEHYQNKGFTGSTRVTGSYGGEPEPETEEQLNARAQMDRAKLLGFLKGYGSFLGDVSTLPLRTGIGGLQALGDTRFGRALGLNFTPPNALSAPWNVGMPMTNKAFAADTQAQQALLDQQQKAYEARQAPINTAQSPERGGGNPSGIDAYRSNVAAASADIDAAMTPRGNPALPPRPEGKGVYAFNDTVNAAAPGPALAALQAAATQQGGGGAPRSGVGSLVQTPEQYREMMGKFRADPTKVKDPFADQAAEAGRARIAASETARDQLKQDIEALGEFGKEREARLKAREAKLGKQEGETTGLALLKAGFAMMSGASPHAFVNIGAGAGIGVDEYTKGKEKIDAARERLDEAYSRLDEIRRGEKVANARELRAANKEVKLAEADVKDKGVTALREQFKMEEDKARELVNAYTQDRRTQATLESHERTAAQDRQSRAMTTAAQIEAQKEIAAMPGAEQKLYTALGGGDILKGFEKAKTIMQETKKDLMTEYTEWLKANPMAGMEPDGGTNKFLKQKMMFSGLGSIGKTGFTNPGANDTVLKPKQ